MSIPVPVVAKPDWPESDKLPYIIVAGLLPDQLKAVGNVVDGKAKLEEWNSNGSTHAKPDFYVVTRGFFSHSDELRIKATGCRIMYANRGVQSVIWAIQRGLSGKTA
jgi:hypothetical protein